MSYFNVYWLIFGLLFVLVIRFWYLGYANLLKIRRWQDSLNLSGHQQVFTQLYSNIDGFALSRQARSTQDAMEYTYGEIEFIPFIALLSLVKPGRETIFYDLGSGTGKAVLACAMVYPVHKSVGIELFAELHHSALEQQQKLAAHEHYSTIAKQLVFVQGNFLEADLNDATLIFINATACIGATWEQLNRRLDKLPNLTTIITTTKPLLANNYFLEKTAKVQMSWGVVTAFIYQKKLI